MVDDLSTDWAVPATLAIPRLVALHGDRLYTVARRVCGHTNDAEDLVQEVFLQAWRKWDQFRGDSDPFPWLITIATRACQRMRRPRAGEPTRIASLDECSAFRESSLGYVPDVVDEVLRREIQDRVGEAIAALPDDFRIPLVLKDILGANVEQIARALDLVDGTVKTRLHRARMKVRDTLERALPRREVAPPAYSEQVCLDLLRAKHQSLDRQVEMPGMDDVICERCQTVFATLDLTQDACRRLLEGEQLPSPLRRRLATPPTPTA